MDRAEQMAQLRKDFVQAEKDKAGLESKKESVLDQKKKALDELAAKGIKYEDIDARIQEAETKVDLVVGKMDSIKKGSSEEVAV